MKPITIIFLILVACTVQQPSAKTPLENTEQQAEHGLIAGKIAKYYEWDKNKFEQALREGKIVYLEFSANWCNTCKAQHEHLKAGFEELQNPNVIGFRIHYKDDETTTEMEEMAKKYGIAYQHTKIIIKDGKVVLKSPEGWEHTRFLEEIKKIG